MDADYVLFVGDDVHLPANAFLQLASQDVDIVTGIYWTKGYPTEPYIWRGIQKGPYLDWKVGEFFEIDMTGCDCLLVKTDVFRSIPGPWFSCDWDWNGEGAGSLATEDFYFYAKAKEAGYKVWADSMVQCYHEDRTTGMLFGIREGMPQATFGYTEQPDDVKPLKVADLGSGIDTPYFGKLAQVTRFDTSEKVRPDVRCDLRSIPSHYRAEFDIVHARHVLEHFDALEAQTIVKHWAELVKVGGVLKICVPDMQAACEEIAAAENDERAMDPYALMQLYGGQADTLDYHKNGFTQRTLRLLLERNLPGRWAVHAWRNVEQRNLYAEAKLIERTGTPSIIAPFQANRIETGERSETCTGEELARLRGDGMPRGGVVEAPRPMEPTLRPFVEPSERYEPVIMEINPYSVHAATRDINVLDELGGVPV